jgi:hypothetical protein
VQDARENQDERRSPDEPKDEGADEAQPRAKLSSGDADEA